MKCHQRVIREQKMEQDPRPVMTSLDGCLVRAITVNEAKPIILTYEWLGTLPNIPKFQYGLFDPDNELIGVAMFGQGNGNRANLICGEKYKHLAVPLERGACVHWAPKNAASHLIRHACRQAYLDHGYRIFYAYADVEAGEIGTIYQSASWDYIGQGIGTADRLKVFLPPKNNPCNAPHQEISEQSQRRIRKKCGHTMPEHLKMGWEERWVWPRRKYVCFEGSKRKKRLLKDALLHPVLDYPKRNIDNSVCFDRRHSPKVAN